MLLKIRLDIWILVKGEEKDMGKKEGWRKIGLKGNEEILKIRIRLKGNRIRTIF